METRKCRAVIHEGREISKMNTMTGPIFCLEAFSSFTELSRQESVFRASEAVEIVGQNTSERKAMQRRNFKNLYRGLLSLWHKIVMNRHRARLRKMRHERTTTTRE